MLKNKIATVKEFAQDHKPELLAVAVTIVAGTLGAIAYKNYCDVIDMAYADDTND